METQKKQKSNENPWKKSILSGRWRCRWKNVCNDFLVGGFFGCRRFFLVLRPLAVAHPSLEIGTERTSRMIVFWLLQRHIPSYICTVYPQFGAYPLWSFGVAHCPLDIFNNMQVFRVQVCDHLPGGILIPWSEKNLFKSRKNWGWWVQKSPKLHVFFLQNQKVQEWFRFGWWFISWWFLVRESKVDRSTFVPVFWSSFSPNTHSHHYKSLSQTGFVTLRWMSLSWVVFKRTHHTQKLKLMAIHQFLWCLRGTIMEKTLTKNRRVPGIRYTV